MLARIIPVQKPSRCWRKTAFAAPFSPPSSLPSFPSFPPPPPPPGIKGETYVGNSESGEIVALAVLAAHPLSSSRSTAGATQRRWHVRALLASTRRALGSGSSLVSSRSGGVGGSAGLADGGHGVLVGTAGGEMLAVADTALDLLVLQLVLHGLGVGVLALVLGVLAPVEGRLEDDVLADRGGVGGRTGAVLGAKAELGPRLAVGDAGVDDLAVGDVADASCSLDLLAVVVQAVLDDGRAAILVGDLLGGREFGGGLLELVIVGPIVPVWSRTLC